MAPGSFRMAPRSRWTAGPALSGSSGPDPVYWTQSRSPPDRPGVTRVSPRSIAPPGQTPDTWLDAVGRVMARIGESAGGAGMLDVLARGVVEEFGVAMVAVWVYDPADDALH